MDKLPMSPQMKSILLSLKTFSLNPAVSQDLGNSCEEEKDLSVSRPEQNGLNPTGTQGKFSTSQKLEYGSKSFNFDKLYLTVVQENKTSAQSKESLRPLKRSWAVSRQHILVRSNTVDSLPVQKSIKCKEIIKEHQCCTETRSNSAPQSPVIERKANITAFDKRIKPKSALVVSNQISPAIGQKQLLDGIKTRRVSIKPSSAGIKRRSLHKAERTWENLSEERSFLINKWLAYRDL